LRFNRVGDTCWLCCFFLFLYIACYFCIYHCAVNKDFQKANLTYPNASRFNVKSTLYVASAVAGFKSGIAFSVSSATVSRRILSALISSFVRSWSLRAVNRRAAAVQAVAGRQWRDECSSSSSSSSSIGQQMEKAVQ